MRCVLLDDHICPVTGGQLRPSGVGKQGFGGFDDVWKREGMPVRLLLYSIHFEVF